MVRSTDRRVQFSQNLLHNPALVTSLVNRSNIGSGDVVLEIGPGRGIITEVLAARASHVLAIEKDPVSTSELESRFRNYGNITVFCADFMDFPLPATAFKVFSNIPYNITTAIVGKLTSGLAPPTETWLVMQHEAALKLIGSPRQTLVSLSLLPRFEYSIEHQFRRSDFRPIPGVDSVLLRMSRRETPLIDRDGQARFEDFLTALFTAWKPTVREALASVLPRRIITDLDGAFGSALLDKPGDTAPAVWLRMFRVLSNLDDPQIWQKITGAASRLAVQQSELRKEHRSRTSGRNQRVRAR